MTYGKLRQFRRDRLYANDRERMQYLIDVMKKNRIPDDQQQSYSHFFGTGLGASPNKTNQGKNWEKNQNTNKISPSKNPTGQKGLTDNTHNNG